MFDFFFSNTESRFILMSYNDIRDTFPYGASTTVLTLARSSFWKQIQQTEIFFFHQQERNKYRYYLKTILNQVLHHMRPYKETKKESRRYNSTSLLSFSQLSSPAWQLCANQVVFAEGGEEVNSLTVGFRQQVLPCFFQGFSTKIWSNSSSPRDLISLSRRVLANDVLIC